MTKYKCKKEFVMRIPYFSIDFYNKNLCDDNVDLVKLTKNHFLENIKTISNDLYISIHNNSGDNKKIEETLLKYLIRSSSRTTPYGMTSGIIPCSFDKSSEEKMKFQGRLKQFLRVDLEWLVPIVKILESKLNDKLIVKTNNTLIKNDERVYNLWLSCFQNDNNFNKDKISIKNNKVVEYILTNCKDGITKGKLIVQLEKNCPNIPKKTISSFINELMHNEILISNLRFCLVNNDCFEYVIKIMDEYNTTLELVGQLKDINNMIYLYNNQDNYKDDDLYTKIKKKMSEIYHSDNYLRIDSYSNKGVYLSEEYKRDVEEFLEFLKLFAIKKDFKKYIFKFKEEFGNQAVKLLDLIDRDDELSMPTLDQDNLYKLQNHVEKFMWNEMQNGNREVIELSKLKSININQNADDLSSNLELSFYPVNYNNYSLICSPMIGSNSGGQSIGRFRYLFPNNFINDNIPKNQVEVTYLPKKARYANVMNCNTDRKTIFNYGGYLQDDSFSIDDIYVFIENDDIKFINKNSGEILDFYINNKINRMLNPKIINYLLAVNDRNDEAIFQLFYVLKIICDKLIMTPRIVYKNIVLFPKSWKIINESSKKNFSKEEFLDFLKGYISFYKIPTKILVGEMDQRILLDLNSKRHVDILYGMWKKNNNIKIYESFFENNNLCLKDDNNNKYVCEVVFEMEKNFKNKKRKKMNLDYIDQSMIIKNSFLPFDKWISLKIYLAEIDQDNIISDLIYKDIEDMVSDNLIKKYFYIRYRDPYPHIRLRLNISCNQSIDTIMMLINKKFKKYYNGKIIKRIIIDTYIPEVQRYGGEKLIEDAEKIFYKDSIVSSQILRMIKEKTLDLDKSEVYIISILKLMKDMNIPLLDQEKYLSNFKLTKNERKKCRTIKEKIDNHFDISNELFESQKNVRYMNMYLILEQRSKLLKDYWDKVELEYKNEPIKKIDILLSIAHMHHNRLVGIDREKEKFLMACIEYYVHALNDKEKYYKKYVS